MYTYKAKVVRIVDGDTVRLCVDCGFRLTFTDNFRLSGINAPELNQEGGQDAKSFLSQLLPVGLDVIINTSKSDKYGRWLCVLISEVYPDGEINVNQTMVDNGYAVAYMV